MASPDLTRLLAVADTLTYAGDAQSVAGPLSRTVGLDYDATNRVYFGVSAGPLTPATAGRLDTSPVPTVLAWAGPITNKGDSRRPGDAPVATTLQWKVSQVINNGTYGRFESHVYGGSSKKDEAIAAGITLAAFRATMLGADAGNSDKKTLGTPRIEYLRVSDPVNPRLSQLITLPLTGDYCGPGTAALYAADFFSTALTLRLTGTTVASPSISRSKSLLIIGQPDECVQSGRFKATALVSSGQTFLQRLQAYLAQLVASSQWGFMGQDPAQAKLPVSGSAVVGQSWVMTIPANPYQPRDRIRLSGVNVRGFNGVYVVSSSTAGTVTLANGPPLSLPAPTTGFAQRTQLGDGTRCVVYYRYDLAQLSLDFGSMLRPSKKNPGRQFSAVSFRHRPRRLH